MTDQIIQMSDDIRQLQVIEVKRTTELPELRAVFSRRDCETAEQAAECYRKLTGRAVDTVYYYRTPTLGHVFWCIDVEARGHNGTDTYLSDS